MSAERRIADGARALAQGLGAKASLHSRLAADPAAILQESLAFLPAAAPPSATSTLKAKYRVLKPKHRKAVAEDQRPSTSSFVSNLDWGRPKDDASTFRPPSAKASKGEAAEATSPVEEAPRGDGVPPPALDLHRAHVQMEWEPEELRLKSSLGAGLCNQGNTCFLNSVLQVLTHTPPLVHFLLSSHSQCTGARQGFCGMCELKTHIAHALLNKRPSNEPMVPNRILQRMRCFMKSYMRGRQEDAHELLRYLLDSLQTACLLPYKAQKLDIFSRHTTPIGKIFGGYHRNEITCMTCQAKSTTYDPFMDVSLEVKRFQTIEEALKNFTKVEYLSHDNAYKCVKCNRHVKARKQYTIHRPPAILTIQLKRFDSYGKISHQIKYPEKLNLRPFMSDCFDGTHLSYKLYASIVHHGNSTHSGHYYAFVRNTAGAFYMMDDDRVSPVQSRLVAQQNAYLLFYARSSPPQTATVKPRLHATPTTATAAPSPRPTPSPAFAKPPVHAVGPMPTALPAHKPICINLKRGGGQGGLLGTNPLGVKPKKEEQPPPAKRLALVPYGSDDESSPDQSPSASPAKPQRSASNSPSYNVFSRLGAPPRKAASPDTPAPKAAEAKPEVPRARTASSGDESGIRIKLNLREGRVEQLSGASETELAIQELREQTAERERESATSSNSDDSVKRRRKRKRERREPSSESEREETEEEARTRRKKERKEAKRRRREDDDEGKKRKKKKKKHKHRRRSESPRERESESRERSHTKERKSSPKDKDSRSSSPKDRKTSPKESSDRKSSPKDRKSSPRDLADRKSSPPSPRHRKSSHEEPRPRRVAEREEEDRHRERPTDKHLKSPPRERKEEAKEEAKPRREDSKPREQEKHNGHRSHEEPPRHFQRSHSSGGDGALRELKGSGGLMGYGGSVKGWGGGSSIVQEEERRDREQRRRHSDEEEDETRRKRRPKADRERERRAFSQHHNPFQKLQDRRNTHESSGNLASSAASRSEAAFRKGHIRF